MNIIKSIFSKTIQITESNNNTLIKINQECSINFFKKFISKTKHKHILNYLNVENLIQNNFLLPQTILIIKKENYSYTIISNKEQTLITKIEHNRTIQIKTSEESYEITINNIKYPNDKTNKEETLIIISNILDELSSIPFITEHLNIKKIYQTFNLINSKNYFPLIKSDTLTLSWKNNYGSTDINQKTRATLEIILNSTNEKVGEISFNLLYKPEHSYIGNVSYYIKDEFMGHHYATEALSLLKLLIKMNNTTENKDLYISTSKDNKRSQKVAINNDGELFYEGEVPQNDPIRRHSGIDKVKIYRIKI